MQKIFSQLIQPGIRLFARLSYKHKFLTISLVSIIPVIFLLSILVAQSFEQKDFEDREDEAIEVLRLTDQLFAYNQFPNSEPVAADLHAMENRLQEIGKLMPSGNKPLSDSPEFKNVTQHLAAFKQSLQHGSSFTSTEFWPYHQSLTFLRNRITADNLALDPELSSYFLQRVLTFDLPTVRAKLYHIDKLVTLKLQQPLTSQQDHNLIALLGTVKSNLQEINFAMSLLKAEDAKTFSALQEIYQNLAVKVAPLIDSTVLDNKALEQSYRQNLSGIGIVLATFQAACEQQLITALDERAMHIFYLIIFKATVSSIFICMLIYMFAAVSGNISQTVHDLENGADNLKNGNLVFRFASKSKDELSGVGIALNNVVESMAQLIGCIRGSASELSVCTEQLVGQSETMMSSCAVQKQNAQEVAGAIGQLEQCRNEVEQAVAGSQQQALQAMTQSDQGMKIILDTAAQMHYMVQAFKMIGESVRRTGEASGKIQSLASSISEIAKQTNLLALNAAIEAARAGEHGRGFAVVADEVRSLATRTSNQSASIAETVNDITRSVQESIEQIDTELENIDLSIELSSKASEAIQQIRQGTEQVNQSLSEMSKTIHDQQHNSAQIGNVIKEMACNSQSNAELVQDSVSQLVQIDALAHQLRSWIKQFKLEASNFDSTQIIQRDKEIAKQDALVKKANKKDSSEPETLPASPSLQAAGHAGEVEFF